MTAIPCDTADNDQPNENGILPLQLLTWDTGTKGWELQASEGFSCNPGSTVVAAAFGEFEGVAWMSVSEGSGADGEGAGDTCLFQRGSTEQYWQLSQTLRAHLVDGSAVCTFGIDGNLRPSPKFAASGGKLQLILQGSSKEQDVCGDTFIYSLAPGQHIWSLDSTLSVFPPDSNGDPQLAGAWAYTGGDLPTLVVSPVAAGSAGESGILTAEILHAEPANGPGPGPSPPPSPPPPSPSPSPAQPHADGRVTGDTMAAAASFGAVAGWCTHTRTRARAHMLTPPPPPPPPRVCAQVRNGDE